MRGLAAVGDSWPPLTVANEGGCAALRCAALRCAGLRCTALRCTALQDKALIAILEHVQSKYSVSIRHRHRHRHRRTCPAAPLAAL